MATGSVRYVDSNAPGHASPEAKQAPTRPFDKLRVVLSKVERRASASVRGDKAGSPTRQPRWGARGAPPPMKNVVLAQSLTNCGARQDGVGENLFGHEGGELSMPFENASIDHDRVDV